MHPRGRRRNGPASTQHADGRTRVADRARMRLVIIRSKAEMRDSIEVVVEDQVDHGVDLDRAGVASAT
jgi:hypothetical protein